MRSETLLKRLHDDSFISRPMIGHPVLCESRLELTGVRQLEYVCDLPGHETVSAVAVGYTLLAGETTQRRRRAATTLLASRRPAGSCVTYMVFM